MFRNSSTLVTDLPRCISLLQPAALTSGWLPNESSRSYGSTVKRTQAFRGTNKTTAGKGSEEGKVNPKMQQIIDMLLAGASESEQRLSDSALAGMDREAEARMRRYLQLKVQEEEAWRKDMRTKFMLQRAAMWALPAALRKKASIPDMSPFPQNRKFMFDSPPTEYAEADLSSSVEPAQAAGGGKSKSTKK